MLKRIVSIGVSLVFFGSAPFLFVPNASAQAPSAEPIDENLAMPEMFRLSSHKGLYFLYGNPSGKVQISAKHKLVEKYETYFGYTQMMLWQFGKESNPFSDVNFNPELFHRFVFSPMTSIDFGPVEHLSNGRDGAFSRGLNTSYLRFNHAISSRAFRLDGGVKLFALWELDGNNQNIGDYMGFWTGELSASFKDIVVPFWQIYGRVNPGAGWGNRLERGNQEVALLVKFDRGTEIPFLCVQYFNGYGESLLTYNQISSAIRIGIRR